MEDLSKESMVTRAEEALGIMKKISEALEEKIPSWSRQLQGHYMMGHIFKEPRLESFCVVMAAYWQSGNSIEKLEHDLKELRLGLNNIKDSEGQCRQ